VGSWTFSRQGQAECAEFVADHNVTVDKLFTHRWRLDQAEEAYRLFDTQTTGKGVILPQMRIARGAAGKCPVVSQFEILG
jgi:threonine dehydrogenase-like Zn-dependent dehydrogenase